MKLTKLILIAASPVLAQMDQKFCADPDHRTMEIHQHFRGVVAMPPSAADNNPEFKQWLENGLPLYSKQHLELQQSEDQEVPVTI